MKQKKQDIDNLVPDRANRKLGLEASGAAAGAVAGAALGAVAGPPGIVAGAVIGGVAGVIAGAALERDNELEADRTSKLDDEIGVTSGTIGDPNLKHPPAKTGAYSGASAGAPPSSGESSAEGPLQSPD